MRTCMIQSLGSGEEPSGGILITSSRAEHEIKAPLTWSGMVRIVIVHIRDDRLAVVEV